jgi:hypothetical protein
MIKMPIFMAQTQVVANPTVTRQADGPSAGEFLNERGNKCYFNCMAGATVRARKVGVFAGNLLEFSELGRA